MEEEHQEAPLDFERIQTAPGGLIQGDVHVYGGPQEAAIDFDHSPEDPLDPPPIIPRRDLDPDPPAPDPDPMMMAPDDPQAQAENMNAPLMNGINGIDGIPDPKVDPNANPDPDAEGNVAPPPPPPTDLPTTEKPKKAKTGTSKTKKPGSKTKTSSARQNLERRMQDSLKTEKVGTRRPASGKSLTTTSTKRGPPSPVKDKEITKKTAKTEDNIKLEKKALHKSRAPTKKAKSDLSKPKDSARKDDKPGGLANLKKRSDSSERRRHRRSNSRRKRRRRRRSQLKAKERRLSEKSSSSDRVDAKPNDQKSEEGIEKKTTTTKETPEKAPEDAKSTGSNPEGKAEKKAKKSDKKPSEAKKEKSSAKKANEELKKEKKEKRPAEVASKKTPTPPKPKAQHKGEEAKKPARVSTVKTEKVLAVKAATHSAPPTPKPAPPPPQTGPPVYLDLAYVPAHANSSYADAEFFRRIRCRYYVISGNSKSTDEPSISVLNSLLEGKQMWGNGDFEVTLIPTYDTEAMREWYQKNYSTLEQARINVIASGSKVVMQDESFEACKIEF
ncbi:microtubule-associated protein 1S-like [Branchiostoma floridae]|uniref:Microtubule-associated protein 1S-like n=1 Tax=Branchiostoma floridae TaxID=7739 RepID=A0A9J7NAW0_BRAFL|nr:microtubule-associated protein 1S-like [Branchiostoma floridae]